MCCAILTVMPSEKIDVVRRQWTAFESGGSLDAVAAFWHPAIEWRAVEGAADDAGVLEGLQAMRRYYEDWVETFEDMRTEVEEVLGDAGENLAVVLRVSGRGRESGVRVDARYSVVYTIREALIVRGREYATPAEALAALERLGLETAGG
jgi:ketosteroid isomerase-like protein